MNTENSAVDLGLRFVVEPSSTELTSEERELLADLRPAGVMFRRRNFSQEATYDEWLSQLDGLLTDIRRCIQRDRLIVSVDHEGGRVHRYPPPITRFPYPAFYGGSDEAIELVAGAMAVELKSVGVNVSFSPVADIHSNPANPVINQRAFGRTAAEVSRRVIRFARALKAKGVVPCAKHFPGHGDTASDSHYTLPIVDRSLEELDARELAPFAALIADGIEMIMSAHIILPQIDAEAQATLSRPIMTELLRERLGFSGVVIADALGMKAIHDDVSDASFARRAHDAGIDLLLMVGDPVSIKDALRVRDGLAADLNNGLISWNSLRAAQSRVEMFLSSLPSYAVKKLEADVFDRHTRLAQSLVSKGEWEEFHFAPEGFE